MTNAHSARPCIAPRVRANPVGPVEVGEHQVVEKLGAGSGAEGVKANVGKARVCLRKIGLPGTGVQVATRHRNQSSHQS
jgi:hypothetical protein